MIKLKKNLKNKANLILHSQGADIGYLTLRILSNYQNRIRVITLGGMVSIPEVMAFKVKNYVFQVDWVASGLAYLYEQKRKEED